MKQLVLCFLAVALAYTLSSCSNTNSRYLEEDPVKKCTNYEPKCSFYGATSECTYTKEGCKSCVCVQHGKPSSDPLLQNQMPGQTPR